ncbi:FAD-dependent oxidoreductase [Salegentibacter sp. BDJ18]|uniref:FAD-dependent oxidoreductase n=1 Tax=Salegentibacter sp. BDJ18 TaxID=2816376 RepID=UPI001AAF38DC|nr:FAD-dependent oxidoreductase [Salegentibacter sp. BDJ18]MBO2546036.1 FAD-dependent oxidoreductase [Salegentibacter sp. BDJ18]
MISNTIWNSFETVHEFPVLKDNLQVDVSIIGGGITGISTAYFLKKAGLKVAVLDAGKIGMGTTGHSTGNLYHTVAELLSSLDSKYDETTIKKVLKARTSAIGIIEKIIHEEALDCDFKRQPIYLFSTDNADKIEKEISVSSKLGVSLEDVSPEKFSFEATKILKYPDQAQFNPFLYVNQLAYKINSKECQIFQDSKVEEIEKLEHGDYNLKITNGNVSSKYLVHAAHSSKGVDIKFDTTLGPYREYAVAASLKTDDYLQGIFWEYKGKEKYSFRSYNRNGKSYVMAVGKSYKVGQSENNSALMDSLVKYLEEKFPVEKLTHFWGGQNYKPADLLPSIGRKSIHKDEFIATGFSTDGLIYGSLAGKIITDLITNKKNEYEDVFDPLRVNPVKSSKSFIRENLNVAKEFFKDHILGSSTEEIEQLNVGEGRIVEIEGKKFGVSRDANNQYEIVSASCTHLGCVIHWNDLEKSWDCPCHGSRFTPSGEVIEGPAMDALPRINDKN